MIANQNSTNMLVARYRVDNPLIEIWNFSYFFFFACLWVKTHRTPLVQAIDVPFGGFNISGSLRTVKAYKCVFLNWFFVSGIFLE